MANKQVFTAFDVYGFKKALALWAAKNNALIEKYENLLKLATADEDSVYSQTPSASRDENLRVIGNTRTIYSFFLDDLRKPCDSFISELEFQNIGKENG